MKQLFKTVIILSLFSITLCEIKIGYIDSQVIMMEFEDVKQVQVELEKEQRRLEEVYTNKVNSYDSLRQAIETGSIILSNEKIRKMESDLLLKQQEIEQFQLKYFGPQGELYKMQENLLQPILSTIDGAIQKIGREKGYDYIFDAVQGSIVYALDANNLTLDILEELKRLKSTPDESENSGN